jgi:hypothetical protein
LGAAVLGTNLVCAKTGATIPGDVIRRIANTSFFIGFLGRRAAVARV